jgi:hypothetical protein
MPQWMHWEWLNEDVELTGPGHYPDTVMVKHAGKEYEACLKDLVDKKG